MEDLLLDSISEKLSAIDQKTTEIVKTTGETSRSIDQIRSRLSSLESIKKSTIGEIQPPQRTESKGNRPFWSLAPQNYLWDILVPILIALGSMVALSFVLTTGLRTSLLLPYLKLSNPQTIESSSPPVRVNGQRSQKGQKNDTHKEKIKKAPTPVVDSGKRSAQP